MQPQPAPQPTAPDPDLTVDIELLMADVVPDHEVWKVTPNPVFGFKRPVDLIGTPHEPVLRNMLRAAKHGMFS